MQRPHSQHLSRRDVLKGLAAAPLVAAAGSQAPAADAAPSAGLNTLQKLPDNLEFKFSGLNSVITPTEHFYVRNHFDPPTIDVKSWKLKVEGHVERPFEIGLDELRSLQSKTQVSLLECAGNGRVFLKAPQLGLRWELGGVSNGEWTGVPLSALLEKAGVKRGAVDVILEGADKGAVNPPFPTTPGTIPFARSLPLAKAMAPEVMIAHTMNGQPLTGAHGFPARAIVAGWYGMASVKWLTRIIVSDRPFNGYFQTFQYTTWERHGDQASLKPVGEIAVKSQIARPAGFEVVPVGKAYRVFGAAWAGSRDVAKVEFSSDRGKSWSAATIQSGKGGAYSWVLWETSWTPSSTGTHILMSRATDSAGDSQPLERNADLRDAMITHTLPVEVEVR
ncbi:MAG TPA: sulfite oxidase [Caulifigura sp.]|nr:sulfite oxidase [Caulifigura sp.]